MKATSNNVMKGIFWSAVASAVWGISGTTVYLCMVKRHLVSFRHGERLGLY